MIDRHNRCWQDSLGVEKKNWGLWIGIDV